jgi:hypothetical protein
LTQIYREIQSKAPLIQQQRAEYERVARAHVAVSAALEAAVRQQETWRAKSLAAEHDAKAQAAVRAELDSQVLLVVYLFLRRCFFFVVVVDVLNFSGAIVVGTM